MVGRAGSVVDYVKVHVIGPLLVRGYPDLLCYWTR